MILVIPSIDIRAGKCARLVQSIPGSRKEYSDDPVQMAILWRGENAKLLHVADLDGTTDGVPKNIHIIREIVKSVDIPIQASAGVQSYETAITLFNAGASRVVLSAEALVNEEDVKRLIAEYGARKIVIAVDAGKKSNVRALVSLGLQIKSLSVERVIYHDLAREGTLAGPDFHAIRQFAEGTGLKVTAAGGIAGYSDLRRMQELESFGVDSVIIGRALYENRFPCQQLWRQCERELTDFAPTRRV